MFDQILAKDTFKKQLADKGLGEPEILEKWQQLEKIFKFVFLSKVVPTLPQNEQDELADLTGEQILDKIFQHVQKHYPPVELKTLLEKCISDTYKVFQETYGTK